jgi:flavin-binding protein dodecin
MPYYFKERQEIIMPEQNYKLIKLVGSSTISCDDAIKNAIANASLTEEHVSWFEVTETRRNIVDGKVAHYQTTLKVSVKIEE